MILASRLGKRSAGSGATENGTLEEGMARLCRAGSGGRELGAKRPAGKGRPTGREAGTPQRCGAGWS